MMRIANNLRAAHAVTTVATMSIILAATGCAQDNKSTKKPLPAKINWPAVAPSALQTRFIKSLGYGGATLELKDDSRFEFLAASCTYFEKCAGQYKIESGIILLDSDESCPSIDAAVADRRIESKEWRTLRVVPIESGERLYLVDEDKIVDFCNSVNAGEEPVTQSISSWPYFVRDGDWKKPAVGKPRLPKKYAEFILDESFEATVVKQDEYVLKLDKGFDDGVRVGLKFWAEFEDQYKYTTNMEVVSVEERSCIAEVRGGRWPEPGETVSIRRPETND